MKKHKHKMRKNLTQREYEYAAGEYEGPDKEPKKTEKSKQPVQDAQSSLAGSVGASNYTKLQPSTSGQASRSNRAPRKDKQRKQIKQTCKNDVYEYEVEDEEEPKNAEKSEQPKQSIREAQSSTGAPLRTASNWEDEKHLLSYLESEPSTLSQLRQSNETAKGNQKEESKDFQQKDDLYEEEEIMEKIRKLMQSVRGTQLGTIGSRVPSTSKHEKMPQYYVELEPSTSSQLRQSNQTRKGNQKEEKKGFQQKDDLYKDDEMLEKIGKSMQSARGIQLGIIGSGATSILKYEKMPQYDVGLKPSTSSQWRPSNETREDNQKEERKGFQQKDTLYEDDEILEKIRKSMQSVRGTQLGIIGSRAASTSKYEKIPQYYADPEPSTSSELRQSSQTRKDNEGEERKEYQQKDTLCEDDEILEKIRKLMQSVRGTQLGIVESRAASTSKYEKLSQYYAESEPSTSSKFIQSNRTAKGNQDKEIKPFQQKDTLYEDDEELLEKIRKSMQSVRGTQWGSVRLRTAPNLRYETMPQYYAEPEPSTSSQAKHSSQTRKGYQKEESKLMQQTDEYDEDEYKRRLEKLLKFRDFIREVKTKAALEAASKSTGTNNPPNYEDAVSSTSSDQESQSSSSRKRRSLLPDEYKLQLSRQDEAKLQQLREFLIDTQPSAQSRVDSSSTNEKIPRSLAIHRPSASGQLPPNSEQPYKSGVSTRRSSFALWNLISPALPSWILESRLNFPAYDDCAMIQKPILLTQTQPVRSGQAHQTQNILQRMNSSADERSQRQQLLDDEPWAENSRNQEEDNNLDETRTLQSKVYYLLSAMYNRLRELEGDDSDTS